MKKKTAILAIVLLLSAAISAAVLIKYKKPVNFAPEAGVYCDKAIAFMEKNDFKKAISYLQKSLEKDPRYPKSEYALAVCYIRMNPPDLKSAKEHYQRAKKLGYQAQEWFERHLKRLEGER